MPIPELLAVPTPQVRAELAGPLQAIIALRRKAQEYHDTVLSEQAAATGSSAAAMEQTQQTMGAMVRELNVLMENIRKVQSIGDQLDRVLQNLKSDAGA